MKVIINDNVLFEPKFNILYRSDDHTLHYLLPSSATRLLSEFINKNGVLLSRKYLLDTVWKRKGYTASEANLNNAISIIRKGFFELKADRAIINTIPKRGFQFKANVTITQEQNKKQPDKHDSVSFLLEKTKNNKKEYKNRKGYRFIILVTVFLFLALIITAIIESKR